MLVNTKEIYKYMTLTKSTYTDDDCTPLNLSVRRFTETEKNSKHIWRTQLSQSTVYLVTPGGIIRGAPLMKGMLRTVFSKREFRMVQVFRR